MKSQRNLQRHKNYIRGYMKFTSYLVTIRKSQAMFIILQTLVFIIFTMQAASFAFSMDLSKESDRKQLSEEVDKLFADCDKPNSPGCAAAVIHNGEIIHKRGYGMANLEYGVPIKTDTIFGMASVSKQFTAILIALMAEKGQLSLDDDIRKFIPEMPDYGHRITIRHLIYHTSGIRDYFTLWYFAGKDIEDTVLEEEVLQTLARQKELNFKPGDEHLYSNSGYFLLELIIKQVSGKSVQEAASEKIFKPLGMKNTFYLTDKSMIIKNRANGYFTQKDGTLGGVNLKYALAGAGGLYTNLEDFAIWNNNFYQNKLGTGKEEFITQALTNGKLNNGNEIDYGYGLGLGKYRGLKTFAHGGTLGGYRIFSLNFREQRLTVFVFCNLLEKSPSQLSFKIADLYLEKQMEPKPVINPRPVTNTTAQILNETQLSKYVGDYFSDELLTTHRVLLNDDKLNLKIGFNEPLTLNYQGDNIFSDAENQFTIRFQFEKSEISGYFVKSNRLRSLRFNKLPAKQVNKS